jgi:hypothetical protein
MKIEVYGGSNGVDTLLIYQPKPFQYVPACSPFVINNYVFNFRIKASIIVVLGNHGNEGGFVQFSFRSFVHIRPEIPILEGFEDIREFNKVFFIPCIVIVFLHPSLNEIRLAQKVFILFLDVFWNSRGTG